MLTLPFFRPVRLAARLTMPVLLCVCDADTTTPPSSTITVGRRAPRAELRHYPYGHFAIYTDPQVKTDQVDVPQARARLTRPAVAERNSSADDSGPPKPTRV